MPIVIKAQNNDSTNDVIRKFKKATASSNIVQVVKDRRYFQKPSKLRAQKKIERTRLRKKARSLKNLKNTSPESLARIRERLQDKNS